MLNMIWAMGENGEIGLNGKMPWHLPEDLRYFASVTKGSTVIMGRKTFESLGKPLPGRTNVILTRDTEPEWAPPDVWVYNSKTKLLNDVRKMNVFVIGGAEVYRQFMPFADRLYITKIHQSFDADTFIEHPGPEWSVVSYTKGSEIHDYLILEKLGELK